MVDDTGRVIGIVSELDLLRGEFEPDPRARLRPVNGLDEPPPPTVGEVMTGKVITVTEATDVTTAIELMVGRRVKSLPVIRGDALVGIVSRRDLTAMLARPDSSLRDDVLAALREQYPGLEVTVHDGIAELSGPADDVADVITRTVPGIVRVTHRSTP